MFRLTALLCGTIFLTMLLGGQDRGQQRFGLMAQPKAPVVMAAQEEPAVEMAAFVPEKPLMVAAVEAVEPEAVPAVQTTTAGRVMYVTAASVNVRQGPGKGHAVLDRLTRGEAVLEVEAGKGAEGWSLIRIEGDGIEGYVASRLLTQ